MSNVTILVIKDGHAYFFSCHYRTAQRLLENDKILSRNTKEFLDAGYIVVDVDEKFIINCQDAFELKKKRFEILHVNKRI